jgi:HEAT repeat protein
MVSTLMMLIISCVSAADIDYNLNRPIEEWMRELTGTPDDRRHASAAISQIGKNAKTLAARLVYVLNDRDEIVRAQIAMALGNIESEEELIKSALIARVSDPNEVQIVRLNAARSYCLLLKGAKKDNVGMIYLEQVAKAANENSEYANRLIVDVGQRLLLMKNQK